MKIRKVETKRKFIDGIIYTLFSSPKYLIIMLDCVYWVGVLSLVSMFLLSIYFGNTVFMVITFLGSGFAINGLIKHYRFKNNGLFKNDSFYGFLNRIYGGK